MSDNIFGAKEPVNWEAASVDMPPMPAIQTGEDPMSMTIATVVQSLSAPLAANVTALQAKESMFSGKVSAANSAYQNADDQGNQGIGQMGQMLGQVGQMAQQAGQAGGGGGSGGGGSSVFSSLMEQAMKMAQGGGGKDGGADGAGGAPPGDQSQAGQPAPAPAGQAGGGAPGGGQPGGGAGGQGAGPQSQPQPQSREGEPRHEQAPQHDDRDTKQHAAPTERPPAAAAGPGQGQHSAGPAPVAPPEHSRRDDEDLSRRM